MLQKLSTQLATADAKSLASRPTQFDFSTYLKNNPGIQMSISGQKALVAIKVRIPIQSGRGFRFDPGHRSDLMPAAIPK